MKMEQGNKLRKKIDFKLIKVILLLAWPVVAEMSLHTLVGISDTIMIGNWINKEALAAVGFANQIVFPLTFIFGSFNTGATAMIARYTGEKNFEKVQKVLAQNLFLNILLGLVITIVILIFGENLLMIFDTTPEVRANALSYLKIVSLAQVAMFIIFSLSAAFRGVGDTATSMKINGFINILNIVGNFLLIAGPWFFPALGVKGAAFATAGSRIVGSIIFLFIASKGNSKLQLRLSLMKLTKDIFNKLLELSSSAAIEQFFMQLSFTIGVIFISKLSVTSEAAFQILLRIESISFMPALGLGIAASTLVGQALGAKDTDRAIRMGYTSMGLGIVYGIIIGAVFALFPRELLSVFTNDMAVVDESITTLMVAGFNQWILASIIILSGALRGAGDTKAVMFITIIRLWLFQLPFNYLFILAMDLGVIGFWLSEVVTFLIFIIVYLHRFKGKKWTKIKI